MITQRHTKKDTTWIEPTCRAFLFLSGRRRTRALLQTSLLKSVCVPHVSKTCCHKASMFPRPRPMSPWQQQQLHCPKQYNNACQMSADAITYCTHNILQAHTHTWSKQDAPIHTSLIGAQQTPHTPSRTLRTTATFGIGIKEQTSLNKEVIGLTPRPLVPYIRNALI